MSVLPDQKLGYVFTFGHIRYIAQNNFLDTATETNRFHANCIMPNIN